MPPPKASSRHISYNNKSKKDKMKPAAAPTARRPATKKTTTTEEKEIIDLSASIPLTLQQLLLNVFKTGLLSADGSGSLNEPQAHDQGGHSEREQPLDLKSLVQTIKAHLYNRDFESAFTDASEEMLCAYALRWSASRALGYAGVFKAVVMESMNVQSMRAAETGASESEKASADMNHVVCIGGGAGAEIVALAAVWRDLLGMTGTRMTTLEDGMRGVSVEEKGSTSASESAATATSPPGVSESKPRLAVTAVDIADWTRVVDRLSSAIQSSHVPGGKTHPAPLLPQVQREQTDDEGDEEREKKEGTFAVRFRHADVLTLPDEEFKKLLHFNTPATLVTLMFTLNELFSTSMAKATGFLLRLTDLLDAGTLLLVVDSPGSYSTVKLGKGDDQQQRERQYPMKFLLDHALLSVATGKWEKVLSQDSRWWRRDAARLGYDVGEGAGLEDMRYQIHVYRQV